MQTKVGKLLLFIALMVLVYHAAAGVAALYSPKVQRCDEILYVRNHYTGNFDEVCELALRRDVAQ